MTEQDQHATFEAQIELPEVPFVFQYGQDAPEGCRLFPFSDFQDIMQSYARQAIAQAIAHDRQQRGEPVASNQPDEELSSACLDCGGTGLRDSGGIYPWGEAAMIPCDCGAAPQPAEPTIRNFRTVAEPVRVPSDEELKALALELKPYGADGFILRFARALLSRYQSAQPASGHNEKPTDISPGHSAQPTPNALNEPATPAEEEEWQRLERRQ